MNDAYYELSKMKDFLSIYNKMAENCFSRCINTFNYRNLTEEEFQCVDRCASKNINTNHRIMQVYMEIQPEILNKRYEESEKLAAQQQPPPDS